MTLCRLNINREDDSQEHICRIGIIPITMNAEHDVCDMLVMYVLRKTWNAVMYVKLWRKERS